MKRLITLAALLTTVTAFCQSNISAGWQTLYSNNEVEFQTMDVTCADAELNLNTISRLVRITNKTGKAVTISWLNEMYYGGSCVTCNNPGEYTGTVSLPAHEAVAGNCDSGRSFLKIFVKDNLGTIKQEMSGFKVSNIKVAPVTVE